MNSENLNISVGLELDKQQFNEKYIQGAIDNSAGNASIRINTVKLGNVTKDIQNDLSKQASQLKIQIKDVPVDTAGLEVFSSKAEEVCKKFNERLGNIRITGDLDLKNVEGQMKHDLKALMEDLSKELGIDGSKISITGIRGAARDFIETFQSEIKSFAISPKVGNIDLGIIDNLDDELISKIKKSFNSSVSEEFRGLGRELGIKFSKDFIKESVATIKSGDLVKFNNSILDEFEKSNGDYDFSQLEKISNLASESGRNIRFLTEQSRVLKGELRDDGVAIKGLLDTIDKIKNSSIKINTSNVASDVKNVSNEIEKLNDTDKKVKIVDFDIENEIKKAKDDMSLLTSELGKISSEMNNMLNKGFNDDSKNALDEYGKIIVKGENLINSLADGGVDFPDEKIAKLNEKLGDCFVLLAQVSDAHHEYLKNVQSETSKVEVPVSIASKDIVDEIKDVEQEIEKVAKNSNFEMPIDIVASEPAETIISGIEDVVDDVEDSGEFNIELDVFISEESKIRIQKQLEELSEGLSLTVKNLNFNEEIKKTEGFSSKDVELNINTKDLKEKIQEVKTKFNALIDELNSVEPVNVDIDVVITKETRDSINGQLDALGDILELNIEHINISTDTIKNMIESLSKEISDGLNIDLGKLSGKNIDLEALTENIANETTEELNKVESKVDSISKTVNEISPVEIVDDIRNEEALLDRLEKIRDTATEISRISYGTDRNGMLKATIKYVNELGQSISEVWGYNEETGIFGKLSDTGVEQFVNVNKEISKMQETLNKIKGNDLVDTKRIKEAEDSLKSLQENVDRLDTKEATRQIELLNNEIESISKVDKLMARFDSALDIRKSMNLSIEGLEALRDRIQAIDGDTPSSELRKVEKAISRIGSGNSNMIALESIIERATNNLEKFGDVAKGDSALAKLNSVVGTSNELMSQLSSGAIKSVSDVRNLRETVINTVRDLKNLENKKVQLEVQLKGLVDSKTVNKSLTNDIAKQISKITTDNVNTRFTEISDNIKKLKDRASVIEKIDNAVKGVGKNVSELQKDNTSLFDTGKLQKDLDNISGIKTALEELKKSLKRDEDVDLINISRTLEQLDTAEVKLENNIDKLKQLNNLSDKKQQLRDDLKGLAGKIDDGEIAKLREEINKMTVDNVVKEFKDLKSIISGFNKSEGQIVRLNRTISSLQDKVTELKGKVGIEWDSENVEGEIRATEDAIKQLIKTRSKLESGKSVNSNTLTESINNANASYGKLDKSMVKILDNKSKIEALQKEIAASMEIRSDLGLDTSELAKMLDSVSKLDATSKDTAKALENMKESVSKFGQSESQIVKIEKTISDTESSVSELMKTLDKSKDSVAKFGGSFKMTEVNDDLKKTRSIIEELESLKTKLEAGGSTSNVNLTSIINKLNTEYGNLKDTINEATKNAAEFVNLSEKLETSLQTRNSLGADASYVEILVKQLKEVDLTSNDAKAALSDLAKTISGLSIADTQIAKVQDTIAKINKEIEKTKQREPILSEKEAERVGMMEAEVTKLNSVLNKLTTGARYSSTEIQRFCNDGSRSMQGLANTAEAVSNEVGGVFSGLGSAINQGMQTALGFEFLDIFTDQLMQMKDAIVELDNEMVRLKRVTTASAEEYDRISKAANQTAIEMGKTTQETLNATTAFVKMGYSVSEASDYLSKAGLMLSNVAEMDIDSAVNAIVSTMKGMSLDADDAGTIVDVINEAGNKFALNSEDLAEGLRIGSASLKIAGNDLYEASALITAGTEVLQDSKQVANGLRTISMRLRGLSEDGEELNPKLEEMIKTMTGVDLTDTNGQFRSTYDILLDISKAWDTLDTKQQALLLENIAGKTQV